MSGGAHEVIDLCSPDLPIGGAPACKRARIVIPSFDLGSDSDSSGCGGDAASSSRPDRPAVAGGIREEAQSARSGPDTPPGPCISSSPMHLRAEARPGGGEACAPPQLAPEQLPEAEADQAVRQPVAKRPRIAIPSFDCLLGSSSEEGSGDERELPVKKCEKGSDGFRDAHKTTQKTTASNPRGSAAGFYTDLARPPAPWPAGAAGRAGGADGAAGALLSRDVEQKFVCRRPRQKASSTAVVDGGGAGGESELSGKQRRVVLKWSNMWSRVPKCGKVATTALAASSGAGAHEESRADGSSRPQSLLGAFLDGVYDEKSRGGVKKRGGGRHAEGMEGTPGTEGAGDAYTAAYVLPEMAHEERRRAKGHREKEGVSRRGSLLRKAGGGGGRGEMQASQVSRGSSVLTLMAKDKRCP